MCVYRDAWNCTDPYGCTPSMVGTCMVRVNHVLYSSYGTVRYKFGVDGAERYTTVQYEAKNRVVMRMVFVFTFWVGVVVC